jgi:hypothetical protein
MLVLGAGSLFRVKGRLSISLAVTPCSEPFERNVR